MNQQLQLVSIEDDKFVLNKETIKIIKNKIPKNENVTVLSINGALRTGKSFLLNCFLKNLDKNFKGFDWKAGYKPTTSGIWIWSEPVKIMPEGLNKHSWLIVLDTQGIFDLESNHFHNVFIFALSTILSSYQIYNLDKRIQKDHLEYLELFNAYAQLAMKKKHRFQNIMLLVRDWQNFTNENDLTLCNNESLDYYNSIFNKLDKTKTNIYNNYQKLDICMLPFPGNEVIKKEFDGDITKLNESFQIHLRNMISNIFSNLEPKKNLGNNINVTELLEMLERTVTLFNDNDDHFPEPKSILDLLVKTRFNGIRNQAIQYYEDKIKIFKNDPDTFEKNEKILQDYLINFCKKKSVIGTEEEQLSLLKDIQNNVSKIKQSCLDEIRSYFNWKLYGLLLFVFLIFTFLSKFINWVCVFDVCYNVSTFINGVGLMVFFYLLIMLCLYFFRNYNSFKEFIPSYLIK